MNRGIERIYWDRKIAGMKDDLLQKGEQRGLHKGEQQGIAHILHMQLQQKFGTVPDWAVDRIQHANTQTLQQWAINVLHADNVEDVFKQ